MRTVLESGLLVPSPHIEPQLRQDTLNAFNILIAKGKVHPESQFDFQYHPRHPGKVVARIWVPDPTNATESLTEVVFADPKDIITAAGPLEVVRGLKEF